MHLTLDFEYDYDFHLLALSCFEWEYRLAWLINKALGSCLNRADDLEVLIDQETSLHAVYAGTCDEGEVLMTLIKNRESSGIMMPELVQIDYLLKIENLRDDLENITSELRKIPQIRGVFPIEVNTLKHKEYLIIE